MESESLSGHEILLSIAGGVALLLWATRMVRTGIMRAYGAELRRTIGRATESRVTAFAVGTGVAGLLQSSTATAILANSFAERGLLALAAGLAVMLGADLGSTLVVQVLSFDIGWASPALILLGVILFLSSSTAPKPRHLGRVLIGLGLLLLSLSLIVEASAPLRGSEALSSIIAPLARDPVLAVLLAAVLTWVAHSSVAIVLLIVSLASTGVVPPELGFALVLGANAGSGLIPLVLSFSGSRLTRRIPLGNLFFRVTGAVIVLPFVAALAPLVAMVEPEPARQIANFHTVFNLALAAVFLPLTGLIADVVEGLLPEAPGATGRIAPRHLDPAAVTNPPVALACATREVMRMADMVETMLREVIQVFDTTDEKQVARLAEMDDDIDALYEAIKLYLTKASSQALDQEDSARCIELITFTTNLEHIGDIIEKNLLELASKKIRNKLAFSEEGWKELTELHERVVKHMQLAMGVFVSREFNMARRLLAEKDEFRELERAANERHLDRLRGGQIETIETSALHLDILRDLKRIHSHLTSVAYPILETEGALRRSRLISSAESDSAETEADSEDPERVLPSRRSADQSSRA